MHPSGCPFLAAVAAREGYVSPEHFVKAAAGLSRRVCQPLNFDDDLSSIVGCFRLFHGSAGPLPLDASKITGVPQEQSELHGNSTNICAARHQGDSSLCTASQAKQPQKQLWQPQAHSVPPGLPMASISLSFQSGFNSWWRDRQRQRQERQRQRQGRQRPRRRSSVQASKHADGNGASATGPGSSASAAQQHAAGGAADGCPLRRIGGLGKPLGGLLTLAAEQELKCPTAIVQARAVVARLKPVQQLRPQALPLKLLAVGAFTGVANVPSGVWRAHVDKFSPEWFVAVHATIPFIAMLRKACLMPKWAITFTVASAIIGQVMGARFEKARLAAAQQGFEAGVAAAAAPPPLGAETQSSLPVGTGAGACGSAAAARPIRGAWRQTYMVPIAC